MKFGWLLAHEPRTSAQGKTYDRISILDSATRVTSAYNWFRGLATLKATDAIEYDWQPDKTGKFQNLVTLQRLSPEQAGYPGPMPPSWARVANSAPPAAPTPTAAVDPADLDDPAQAAIDAPTPAERGSVPDWRAVGKALRAFGETAEDSLKESNQRAGRLMLAMAAELER